MRSPLSERRRVAVSVLTVEKFYDELEYVLKSGSETKTYDEDEFDTSEEYGLYVSNSDQLTIYVLMKEDHDATTTKIEVTEAPSPGFGLMIGLLLIIMMVCCTIVVCTCCFALLRSCLIRP